MFFIFSQNYKQNWCPIAPIRKKMGIKYGEPLVPLFLGEQWYNLLMLTEIASYELNWMVPIHHHELYLQNLYLHFSD